MKNQKHVPYTYSQLIQGNRVVARFHASVVSKLEEAKRKLATQGKSLSPEKVEELQYNRSQVAYFDDEYERFSLAQYVCGDATVLVR